MEHHKLLPDSHPWFKTNTILLAPTGSHAYGTATAQSDLDYRGIVIPPVDYLLGLNSFSGYDKSGGKNFKNQAGDIDVTLIHLNKFVSDALKGVPNNIEILFIEPEEFIHIDKYGEELLSIKHEFLSQAILAKFKGYAKSQSDKMQNLKSNGATRQDLVDSYGYDTKFYMHTIRLLGMAIEILNKRTFSTKRLNADELIELRNGAHTLEQALVNIQIYENTLEIAAMHTQLKAEPDFNKINSWLTNLNFRYIKENY